MKISVIIPVFNLHNLTENLLWDININTITPNEVIIIDDCSNTHNYLKDKFQMLNISVVNNEENMGTNYCWNKGLELTDGDIICFLNNDLMVGKYFFEHVVDTLKDDAIGICVPNTIKVEMREMIDNYYDKDNIILNKREGWAWSIRRNVAEKIFPIPQELRTFFGDDYIFNTSLNMGLKNIKMMHNRVVHFKTTTFLKFWGKKMIKQTIKDEREIYDKIMDKLNTSLDSF